MDEVVKKVAAEMARHGRTRSVAEGLFKQENMKNIPSIPAILSDHLMAYIFFWHIDPCSFTGD